MDITPLVRPEQKLIQSYGNGFFRVNGEVYRHPILIMGDIVCPWDYGDTPHKPTSTILSWHGQIDVLLMGMGASFKILPPSQRASFSSLGITLDIMDTPSACRTYNVLTAEGRRVACALQLLS
jgi:uncharacterized protein